MLAVLGPTLGSMGRILRVRHAAPRAAAAVRAAAPGEMRRVVLLLMVRVLSRITVGPAGLPIQVGPGLVVVRLGASKEMVAAGALGRVEAHREGEVAVGQVAVDQEL